MKTGTPRKAAAAAVGSDKTPPRPPAAPTPGKRAARKSVPNPKSVPAVRRATAILSLLAEQAVPMSLSQIARAVEILPSTCLHILRELASSRLVAFDPGQKAYRLGSGLVELARAVMRQDAFAEFARPHLQEIAETHDVTATASAMIDADHMACVALAHPSVSMSLNVTLGGRVPSLSGAAGRCMAAFGAYSKSQLRSAFARVRWQIPLRFEDWMEEVNHVSQQGYAEDNGAFALGVTSIAAAVFAQDGSVRGTLGIGVITAQLEDKRKVKIIAALKHAARDIGTQPPG